RVTLPRPQRCDLGGEANAKNPARGNLSRSPARAARRRRGRMLRPDLRSDLRRSDLALRLSVSRPVLRAAGVLPARRLRPLVLPARSAVRLERAAQLARYLGRRRREGPQLHAALARRQGAPLRQRASRRQILGDELADPERQRDAVTGTAAG